jgi:hypothetical protein
MWVVVVLFKCSFASAISCREQDTISWDVDGVRFALEQHA